jgi:hypothetical protein
MPDAIVLVFCVQREGDEESERFVFAGLDLEGAVHRSPPLREHELRHELTTLGLADTTIDEYVQKARAFKTTTTTNDWWDGMFGARRP